MDFDDDEDDFFFTQKERQYFSSAANKQKTHHSATETWRRPQGANDYSSILGLKHDLASNSTQRASPSSSSYSANKLMKISGQNHCVTGTVTQAKGRKPASQGNSSGWLSTSPKKQTGATSSKESSRKVEGGHLSRKSETNSSGQRRDVTPSISNHFRSIDKNSTSANISECDGCKNMVSTGCMRRVKDSFSNKCHERQKTDSSQKKLSIKTSSPKLIPETDEEEEEEDMYSDSQSLFNNFGDVENVSAINVTKTVLDRGVPIVRLTQEDQQNVKRFQEKEKRRKKLKLKNKNKSGRIKRRPVSSSSSSSSCESDSSQKQKEKFRFKTKSDTSSSVASEEQFAKVSSSLKNKSSAERQMIDLSSTETSDEFNWIVSQTEGETTLTSAADTTFESASRKGRMWAGSKCKRPTDEKSTQSFGRSGQKNKRELYKYNKNSDDDTTEEELIRSSQKTKNVSKSFETYFNSDDSTNSCDLFNSQKKVFLTNDFGNDCTLLPENIDENDNMTIDNKSLEDSTMPSEETVKETDFNSSSSEELPVFSLTSDKRSTSECQKERKCASSLPKQSVKHSENWQKKQTVIISETITKTRNSNACEKDCPPNKKRAVPLIQETRKSAGDYESRENDSDFSETQPYAFSDENVSDDMILSETQPYAFSCDKKRKSTACYESSDEDIPLLTSLSQRRSCKKPKTVKSRSSMDSGRPPSKTSSATKRKLTGSKSVGTKACQAQKKIKIESNSENEDADDEEGDYSDSDIFLISLSESENSDCASKSHATRIETEEASGQQLGCKIDGITDTGVKKSEFHTETLATERKSEVHFSGQEPLKVAENKSISQNMDNQATESYEIDVRDLNNPQRTEKLTDVGTVPIMKIKKEPQWNSYTFTQEPDVIFLSSDDDSGLLETHSQSFVKIESDSNTDEEQPYNEKLSVWDSFYKRTQSKEDEGTDDTEGSVQDLWGEQFFSCDSEKDAKSPVESPSSTEKEINNGHETKLSNNVSDKVDGGQKRETAKPWTSVISDKTVENGFDMEVDSDDDLCLQACNEVERKTGTEKGDNVETPAVKHASLSTDFDSDEDLILLEETNSYPRPEPYLTQTQKFPDIDRHSSEQYAYIGLTQKPGHFEDKSRKNLYDCQTQVTSSSKHLSPGNLFDKLQRNIISKETDKLEESNMYQRSTLSGKDDEIDVYDFDTQIDEMRRKEEEDAFGFALLEQTSVLDTGRNYDVQTQVDRRSARKNRTVKPGKEPQKSKNIYDVHMQVPILSYKGSEKFKSDRNNYLESTQIDTVHSSKKASRNRIESNVDAYNMQTQVVRTGDPEQLEIEEENDDPYQFETQHLTLYPTYKAAVKRRISMERDVEENDICETDDADVVDVLQDTGKENDVVPTSVDFLEIDAGDGDDDDDDELYLAATQKDSDKPVQKNCRQQKGFTWQDDKEEEEDMVGRKEDSSNQVGGKATHSSMSFYGKASEKLSKNSGHFDAYCQSRKTSADSKPQKKPSVFQRSSSENLRHTIEIDAQYQKSTAQKKASGVQVTKKNLTNNSSSLDIECMKPPVCPSKPSSTSWLTKKTTEFVKSKKEPGKRTSKRSVSDSSSSALTEKIMAAKMALKTRNFQSVVQPDKIADPHKIRPKPKPDINEDVDDVDLPSASQIIDKGLPLLNPTAVLVKRNKSSYTHSSHSAVTTTQYVTTATVTMETPKVTMATSTVSTCVPSEASEKSSSSGRSKDHELEHDKKLSSVYTKEKSQRNEKSSDKSSHHSHRSSSKHSSSHSKHVRSHSSSKNAERKSSSHDKKSQSSKDKSKLWDRKHSSSTSRKESSSSGDKNKSKLSSSRNVFDSLHTEIGATEATLPSSGASKSVAKSVQQDMAKTGISDNKGGRDSTKKVTSDMKNSSTVASTSKNESRLPQVEVKQTCAENVKQDQKQNLMKDTKKVTSTVSSGRKVETSSYVKTVSVKNTETSSSITRTSTTKSLPVVSSSISWQIAKSSSSSRHAVTMATTSGTSTQPSPKISITREPLQNLPVAGLSNRGSVGNFPIVGPSNRGIVGNFPVASLSNKGTVGNFPVAGPSNRQVAPAVLVDKNSVLKLEIFLGAVLKWNSNWFEEFLISQEKDHNSPPPPVQGDARLYPLVEKYSSFEEYSQSFMMPLLLYETWESVYRTWKEKRSKGRLFSLKMFCASISKPKDKILEYVLHGLARRSDQREGRCVMEGDLAILQMNGNLKNIQEGTDKQMQYSQMAYVDRVVYNDCPVERLLAHNQSLASYRWPDSVSVKIVVRVRWRTFAPKDRELGELQQISPILSTVRQYQALASLPRSPLCKDLLMPSSNLTFCDKTNTIPPHLQKQFNKSQAQAISTATYMVTQPYACPRVCMLQGPPGTGKSHTILGIINQVILNSGGKAKICLCAQSHAAVDELVRRLTKQDRKAGPYKLKIVRMGKVGSVHPDVQFVCLEKLMEKNLTATLKEDLFKKLPVSLQGERKALEKKIEAKKKEIQTSGPLQMKKAKVDLKKLESEREELEKKMNIDVSKLKATPKQEWELRYSLLRGANIIAGTLNSIGSGLMTQHFCNKEKKTVPFDCIIVDEATQATELDSLIPLQFGASKLILVGDPQQLPPTVVSQVAAKHKFGLSLMERLYNHFKFASINPVILLDTQYRMDPEICSFPNNYVYDGKLKTDISVERRSNSCPLEPYLLFDLKQGQELMSQTGGSLSNRAEADFTVILCQYITRHTDTTARHIGIIAPYQNQKNLLKRLLHDRNLDIEVSTVDGFQGREKHVIIMSCVRAQSSSGSIGFVANRNRMNVSMTRAKYSLYVIAHFDSLRACEEWSALIQDAHQRKKMLVVHESQYKQAVEQCLKPSRRSRSTK